MRYIVIAGIVVAIAAVSLPGCGRSKHRARVAEPVRVKQIASPAASPDAQYREALAAWEAWQASEGCSGPERNAFIAAIGRLKDDAEKWNTAESNTVDARIARDRHTSTAFGFADEALARGCYADAERMYRHLLEFYPGEAHASIGERAELGMADARAARGVAEVKPE